MATLKTYHPDYELFKDLQIICRDLYAGEAHVKSKGEIYLPCTSGMRIDGMGAGETGYLDYKAYVQRAVLPGDFEDAVNTRMGLLHQKPAVINLPASLEYLREDADGKGMPLEALLTLINLAQLMIGRIGLAVDATADRKLKLVVYDASSIMNWDNRDSGLQFVILDESGFEIDPNTRMWNMVDKFRLLSIEDGVYTSTTDLGGTLTQVVPLMIGKSFNELPFVFINVTDNQPTPEKPPLTSLANLVLAIYRGEADYRQNLFMQGQDTLVIAGTINNQQINPAGVAVGTKADSAVRVGAGSRINLTEGSTAEYIGVNSQGLPEQRQALEADRKRAESKAGELVNTSATGVESNEALQTRIASRTVTLNHIALSGGRGLQAALRMAARWSGAQDSQVEVLPNLEFNKETLSGAEMKLFTEVNMLGGPISKESIHKLAVKKGLTTMTFEEEMAAVEKERADG